MYIYIYIYIYVFDRQSRTCIISLRKLEESKFNKNTSGYSNVRRYGAACTHTMQCMCDVPAKAPGCRTPLPGGSEDARPTTAKGPAQVEDTGTADTANANAAAARGPQDTADTANARGSQRAKSKKFIHCIATAETARTTMQGAARASGETPKGKAQAQPATPCRIVH